MDLVLHGDDIIERVFDQFLSLLAIGAAFDLGHERGHHASHILRAFRSRTLDGGRHERFQFRFRQRLRKIDFQHIQLGLFFRG